MWSRRDDQREIEAALRQARASASADFVQGLSERIAGSTATPRRAWSRFAFAAALSVFILGTFASFGGLGYAAAGASGSYSAVRQVAIAHKLTIVVRKSSAADQYHHPTTHHHAAFKPPQTHGGVQAAVKVQAQTLPFTGLSLVGTLVVSLSMLGTGIFLRRRERRS